MARKSNGVERRGKEVLAPRCSDVGDKTMGIRGRWPLTAYGHCRVFKFKFYFEFQQTLRVS
jgi:hypothetical protein